MALLANRRPDWLPCHVPELDGLRGIAILAVVLYHCRPSMAGTALYAPAGWGWAGVELFFVLSGCLITGIVLDARSGCNNTKARPANGQFFGHFYLRRALRIWPVYILLLVVTYSVAGRSGDDPLRRQLNAVPWFYYPLFIQNLLHVTLPGPLGPTWSLAIEEQFYVVWAPVARLLRSSAAIGCMLAAVLAASPLLRMAGLHLSSTNTLIHLDGIAFGCLLALLLRTGAGVTRPQWRWIGYLSAAAGLGGTIWANHSAPAFLDSGLALLFAGLVLAAIAASGTSAGVASAYAWLLRTAPLRFYGRISYGLYMTHILVFVLIGAYDAWMDRYGVPGHLSVLAVRLAVSTAVATALWYGFERPILSLKNGPRRPGKLAATSLSSRPSVEAPAELPAPAHRSSTSNCVSET